MKHTDKPTTTASAPETRMEVKYDNKGNVILAEGQSASMTPNGWQYDQRTIPAEKPTAINWCSVAESDADKANRYKAQAAQLAEALRDLLKRVELITRHGGVNVYHNDYAMLVTSRDITAAQALAAYEEGK